MAGQVYIPVKYPGRPPKYKPAEIWEQFVKYVDWANDNPLVVKSKEESTNPRGETWGKEGERQIPRLISVGGFLQWLGCTDRWWSELGERKEAEEYARVKDFVRAYCENYQKEMAAADIFNANIISRLLGLADKIKTEHSGGVSVTSKEEAIANLARMNE